MVPGPPGWGGRLPGSGGSSIFGAKTENKFGPKIRPTKVVPSNPTLWVGGCQPPYSYSFPVAALGNAEWDISIA